LLKQIPVGPMQNFSYIIEDSKEAAIVDAGWEIDRLIKECGNSKIKKIILTHSHYDHVQKVNELAEKTQATIYYHELEANELDKLITDKKAKKLKDNDEITVGKIKIKVIYTPGHTPVAICLLFDKKLITGDTLFVGNIGRVDLPGSNPLDLFESLQKIKKLDDKIEFFPGHDYGATKSSTLGQEKQGNPFLKCSTKEEFLNFFN
jgi:hydroxyacylglutathione hydrolase